VHLSMLCTHVMVLCNVGIMLSNHTYSMIWYSLTLPSVSVSMKYGRQSTEGYAHGSR
jgi:hypothetical protein